MKQQMAKPLIQQIREFVDFKEENIYDGRYNGVVEDNNDPEQNGRCRIRVMGLYDGIETELLPWALPDFYFSGTKKGSFIVPEIGTVVNVYYDDNDIYQPRYYSKTMDLQNQSFQADKTEDYPNSMIFWETEQGDYYKFNRAKGEATFRTHMGVFVKVFQNGNIEVSNDSTDVGSVNLNLRGNFNISNQFGNINIFTNNFNLSGFGDMNITNNGSTHIKTLQNTTIQTNGDCDITTGGATKITAKESCSIESINCNILSNNINFDIATGPATVYNTSGTIDTEDTAQTSKFDMSVGSDLGVPFMAVEQSLLGGPFNCIMFDPMTGQPHQGRHVTGAAVFRDTTKEKTLLAKTIASLNISRTKEIADVTNDIIKKYDSVTEKTKLMLSGPAAIAFTAKKKAEEINSAVDSVNKKYDALIVEAEQTYGSNITSPVFGTNLEPTSPQGKSLIWNSKKPAADIQANLDPTGKTAYYDLIGMSDGLISSEE